MTRSSHRPAPGAVAILLALAVVLPGRLAAQQPTGGQPHALPRDPRAIILDKLKRLDARPDSARDTTAVRDSTISAFERTAPVPTAPGATPIEDDSISLALEKLQGFTPTKYAGAAARFATDSGTLVLTGPAQVMQGGQTMTADTSLVFNQNTQLACGYGTPVLTGAGQQNPVKSDSLCYDTAKRMGVAFSAQTKFQPEGQSSAWYVDGHKLYTMGNDRVFSRDADFTDCDLEEQGKEPHYHFTASQVKIVKNDVLVARNVVLSFADVPVFWLPFMMQSMEKGRRTGILMPRFDLNDIARTNTNYQRRISNVGFYWAVNDHFGALTSLDWFSGNYTALNGAFDWVFRRQFLSGGLAVKNYWQQSGTRNFTLNATNSWRPDESTNVNISASYASSSQFVLDQSFDPRELNRSIDSNLSLQRRFGWGSLDFAGNRHQYLQNDRVTMRLPSVSLSLTPITFFKAEGEDTHWFNNITWNGSANYNVDQDRAHGWTLQNSAPSTSARQGAFSSSLNVGKFAWGQSVNYQENVTDLRDEIRDSTGKVVMTALNGSSKANMGWSTSLSFQQRLFGTSSIAPSLTITGQSGRLNADVIRVNSAGKQDTVHVDRGMTAAPARISFGVGTQMDMYGFWPAVGPFARIRHKLSPSFSYSYSPAPSGVISQAQQDVFGTTAGAITEVNQIRIGLNQTFEAKYKESAEKRDSLASADTTEDNLDGEPRRPPQTRKMTLLAIGTSAVAYDFTQDTINHRRFGFTTTSISNDIRSDLIPGLQFSISHDLFRYDTPNDPRSPRHFSPFLTSASTSFSLSDNSWLFRVLGLAGRLAGSGRNQEQNQVQDTTGRLSAADQANSGTGLSMVPHNRRDQSVSTNGGVGSWNATFTYNLQRSRPAPGQAVGCVVSVLSTCTAGLSTQMIQSRFTFHPTRLWSVGWQTGFNVSERQFSDHVLTLSRDLHDWQANFDFVKAQNGNFTVQFRVALKAQPDLKFDYHQQSGRAVPNYY